MMPILRLAVALVGLAVIAFLAGRRRIRVSQRRREDMRHVIGIEKWWGQR
jgi:hypothetical protein